MKHYTHKSARDWKLSGRRARRGGQNMVEFACCMSLVVVGSLAMFQFALVGDEINSVRMVTRKECRYAAIHATDNTLGLQSDTGIVAQFTTYATEAGFNMSSFSDPTGFTQIVGIDPVANDETRKSGNPISITVKYSLKGKLLVNKFFSNSLQSYTYTATATIE